MSVNPEGLLLCPLVAAVFQEPKLVSQITVGFGPSWNDSNQALCKEFNIYYAHFFFTKKMILVFAFV